jgi:hypothetical protein
MANSIMSSCSPADRPYARGSHTTTSRGVIMGSMMIFCEIRMVIFSASVIAELGLSKRWTPSNAIKSLNG